MVNVDNGSVYQYHCRFNNGDLHSMSPLGNGPRTYIYILYTIIMLNAIEEYQIFSLETTRAYFIRAHITTVLLISKNIIPFHISVHFWVNHFGTSNT